MKNTPVNIFWFRRDLRLNDNHGLYQALRDKNPVVPVFIFDKNILDKLSDKSDRRVEFIYNSILAIKEKLNSFESEIEVIYSSNSNKEIDFELFEHLKDLDNQLEKYIKYEE